MACCLLPCLPPSSRAHIPPATTPACIPHYLTTAIYCAPTACPSFCRAACPYHHHCCRATHTLPTACCPCLHATTLPRSLPLPGPATHLRYCHLMPLTIAPAYTLLPSRRLAFSDNVVVPTAAAGSVLAARCTTRTVVIGSPSLLFCLRSCQHNAVIGSPSALFLNMLRFNVANACYSCRILAFLPSCFRGISNAARVAYLHLRADRLHAACHAALLRGGMRKTRTQQRGISR